MRFNGSDYDHAQDSSRLTSQMSRILDLMRDGMWRGLDEISLATGDPPASVSAQLRHLRKPRFGAHCVLKQHLGRGYFKYRLLLAPPHFDFLD